MNLILKITLASHVIFGLLGVIAFYIVWMALLKRKPSLKFLRHFSFWGLIFLFLSWWTGGYYYIVHYGKDVKPVIKASPYPWAHSVFMEAKEHIFLFLPFLALVIFLAVYLFKEKIESEQKLKSALIFLTGLTTVLGIIITLTGVIISGAVR